MLDLSAKPERDLSQMRGDFGRFTPAELLHQFDSKLPWIQARFPGRSVRILTDRAVFLLRASPQLEVLLSVDGLSDQEIAQSVFYVYFLCDSDAIPQLKKIVAAGGVFVPPTAFSKTRYRFINRMAHDAMRRTWAKADRVSHLNTLIHENLCEALWLTRELPGDYVEIGVFKGGSALTALHFMEGVYASGVAHQKRKAWLMDTFDGFDYPEAANSADAIWAGTHKIFGVAETMAYVGETLSGIKVEHQLVAGNICADELPAEIEQIAVANIDVDMYEPTLEGLRKVARRLVPGGIIICEDAAATPALYGAALAMEEFLSSAEGVGFLSVFKGGQFFLIKTGALASIRP
ncbi:MAG: hypothetical protein RIR70_467 [Pseudomonadota bacterium]